MPYYTVQRKITLTERVIVEAGSKHEAFINAGLNIKCMVVHDEKGDYEPIFDSVVKLNYVSESTMAYIDLHNK